MGVSYRMFHVDENDRIYRLGVPKVVEMPRNAAVESLGFRPAIGSRAAPRDFCGTLLCPTMLSCARRSQRPSSHTVFDQFTANRIRQLRFRHSAQFRSRPAGSPLQGECRRFDPVSTHQSTCSQKAREVNCAEGSRRLGIGRLKANDLLTVPEERHHDNHDDNPANDVNCHGE